MAPARILLIDDDATFRKMARLMLESGGYEVEEAPSGEQGLACYSRRSSDVVITDILMPDMEGIETIRELILIDPAARIIALSGASVERVSTYLGAAKTFGARAILRKPVTLDQLLAAVTDALS